MSGSIATITFRLLDCQFLKLNRSILLVMAAGNIVNPRIGSDPLPPRNSISRDARSRPGEPVAPGWPAGLNHAKTIRGKRGVNTRATPLRGVFTTGEGLEAAPVVALSSPFSVCGEGGGGMRSHGAGKYENSRSTETGLTSSDIFITIPIVTVSQIHKPRLLEHDWKRHHPARGFRIRAASIGGLFVADWLKKHLPE